MRSDYSQERRITCLEPLAPQVRGASRIDGRCCRLRTVAGRQPGSVIGREQLHGARRGVTRQGSAGSPVWFASDGLPEISTGSHRPTPSARGTLAVPPGGRDRHLRRPAVPVGGASGRRIDDRRLAKELTARRCSNRVRSLHRVLTGHRCTGSGPDDVQGSALMPLYRATVSEHWVLIRGRDPDRGSGVDRSERVSLHYGVARPIASCLGRAGERPSWREPRSPTTPRVEGSGRTVLACPTPSRKHPTNQPGTRADPARQP